MTGRIDDRGLFVRKVFKEDVPNRPDDMTLVNYFGTVALLADGVLQAVFENEAMAQRSLPNMRIQ